MNVACSTCLETFTSRSDISTTPCGHVFHTKCIKLWLEKGDYTCSQCRKPCHKVIKLFFSANESQLQEENAVIKLETEKLDLEKKLFNVKEMDVQNLFLNHPHLC